MNATLILNKATTASHRVGLQNVRPTNNAHTIKMWFCGGRTRVRNAVLASAATAGQANLVLTTSAHGWEAGDSVLLLPTNSAASGAVDETEIKAVLSVSGATITLTTNLGFNHLAGSPASNLNSNVVVTSYTVGANNAQIDFRPAINYSGYQKIVAIDTLFLDMGNSNASPMIDMSATNHYSNTPTFDKCAFHRVSEIGGPVFYSTQTDDKLLTNCVFNIQLSGYSGGKYTVHDSVFRYGPMADYLHSRDSLLEDCWLSFYNLYMVGGGTFRRCTIAGGSIRYITNGGAIDTLFDDCDIGYTYGHTSQYGDAFMRLDTNGGISSKITVKDCLLAPGVMVFSGASNLAALSYADYQYINKQRDITAQEAHSNIGSIYRDNTVKFRGASSIKFTPHNNTFRIGGALARTASIACGNGKSIRVVGYVKADTTFYNAGTWNPPTVTISGLSITPVVFTASAAANNSWELFDITATNNVVGYDGNLTLTLSASLQTLSGGSVYFDGVPDAPFITKCRHYGFTLDETNPARKVDPYTVATEAVAAAYTGCTITPATSTVTFSAGTIDTLAKLYDYSQAWAVTHLSDDVPWSRAGALLGLSDGWTVVQPSLSGVTWGGGTIRWTAPGAVTGSFDSNTFEFATAGTYDLSGGTFAGTITLTNTSGGVLVIVLPSGTSYTNTGPSITVTNPGVQLTVTGLVPGSDVVVLAAGTTTILDQVDSVNSYVFEYTTPQAVDIGVIKPGYVPLYIRNYTLGSSSASLPVNQSVDRNYAA